MDPSRQLFAHLDKAFDEVMDVRQPEPSSFVRAIAAEHPDWSYIDVAAEALRRSKQPRQANTRVPV